MKCPYCRNAGFEVVDSRASDGEFPVRRRRRCESCGRRVSTIEQIEETPIKVVKKNGTREQFDRRKILSGLETACYKRPLTSEQLEDVTAKIEAEVYRQFDREIPSKKIGQMVINQLRKLDQVAFVRFASVYREFKDVSDFVEEVQPMLDGR